MSLDVTVKQEGFAQAYVANGGNASRAYRASFDAGNMKSTTIDREAHVLTRNHKIAARITEIRLEVARRKEISVDDVVSGLQGIAESPNSQDGARVRSYELIGRHLGMFAERDGQPMQQFNVILAELRGQGYSLDELRALSDKMSAGIIDGATLEDGPP